MEPDQNSIFLAAISVSLNVVIFHIGRYWFLKRHAASPGWEQPLISLKLRQQINNNSYEGWRGVNWNFKPLFSVPNSPLYYRCQLTKQSMKCLFRFYQPDGLTNPVLWHHMMPYNTDSSFHGTNPKISTKFCADKIYFVLEPPGFYVETRPLP